MWKRRREVRKGEWKDGEEIGERRGRERESPRGKKNLHAILKRIMHESKSWMIFVPSFKFMQWLALHMQNYG